MRLKTKVHFVTVKVRFDEPCTRSHAVREFKDCVWGNFYPMQRDESEPGEFWITGVRSAPNRK